MTRLPEGDDLRWAQKQKSAIAACQLANLGRPLQRYGQYTVISTVPCVWLTKPLFYYEALSTSMYRFPENVHLIAPFENPRW